MESLKSKLEPPPYLVELNSWNLLQSVCLLPYMSLMAVKILMMLLMSVLPFLVTTAWPGLLPRLQASWLLPETPVKKERESCYTLIFVYKNIFYKNIRAIIRINLRLTF